VDVLLGVVVALLVGVVWVVLVRRAAARRRLIGAPKDVAAVLDAYRKGRWEQVATDAPGLLARPSDGGDKTWRPALELALGHALIETDRPDESIAHLERGLLLQSALRRAHGGSDVPESADAKFRHLLGWAYAQTGRTAQARTGLVGLGVALDVGRRIADGDDQYRRIEQPGPGEALTALGGQRGVPVAGGLLRALQDHEVEALGVAGRRHPAGQVEHAVEHVDGHRARVERPLHATGADDVGELHGGRAATRRSWPPAT
jgi:hypothetical protein